MFKSILAPLLLTLVVAGLFLSSTQAGVQDAKDLFAPVFVNRPSELYYSHCDTARYTFQAVSSATGLPSIWVRYRLVSGPGVIDSVTGEWKLGPIFNHDSLGSFELEIGASELGLETEGLQNCHVRLQIEDYLYGPYPTDGLYGDWTVRIGETAERHFRYNGSSGCGDVHSFLESIYPPFAGHFSYQDGLGVSTLACRPDSLDAGGYFRIRIGSTDDLDTSFYEFALAVPDWPSYTVKIKSLADQLQGQFVNVPIVLETHPLHSGLGGFDLLLGYDNSAVSLQGVTTDSSGLYLDCKWEYFTYRFGANGNCSGGCPSGLVRIVGIAETNNGDKHPQCGPAFTPSGSFEMFRLKFLTTNNRSYECAWVPIRFFWIDCSDNTMSSYDGAQLFLEKTVWDADTVPRLVDSSLAAFPGYAGIPSQVCGENSQYPSGRRPPVRQVDFYNGGIGLVCSGSIDTSCIGDINLNFLSNEVADYVTYQNYFLYGLTALGPIQNSLGCTDVNGDGVPLTVADMMYLYLVCRGDELPFPKNHPDTSDNLLMVGQSDIPMNSVWIGTDDALGAIYFVYRGEVNFDDWADGLTWRSFFDGTMTHLLISPTTLDNFPRITRGWIMRAVPADDSTQLADLVSVEAATDNGSPVRVLFGAITDVTDHGADVPTHFALHQNYPNPFNGGTVITFDLPRGAEVSLDVLNILGQVVWNSTGRYAAGSHQIHWNGTGDGGQMVSSGVYYYRLKAGSYVETKKMVLLK